MRSKYGALERLAGPLRERVPFATPVGKVPLVYGYVVTAEDEPDYADACSELLRTWATTRGWEMRAVFRDVGADSTQPVCPAFTTLQEVLQLTGGDASVLVVDKRHLSRKAGGVRELTAEIQRTGATIRALTDELTRAQL